MNDIENNNESDIDNDSTTLEVIEDNPDKSLKFQESVSKKYFNGGKIQLTKLQVVKKKPIIMNIKKPLVKQSFNLIILEE